MRTLAKEPWSGFLSAARGRSGRRVRCHGFFKGLLKSSKMHCISPADDVYRHCSGSITSSSCGRPRVLSRLLVDAHLFHVTWSMPGDFFVFRAMTAQVFQLQRSVLSVPPHRVPLKSSHRMWPFSCCSVPTPVVETPLVAALPADYVVPKVWEHTEQGLVWQKGCPDEL